MVNPFTMDKIDLFKKNCLNFYSGYLLYFFFFESQLDHRIRCA